MVAISQKEIIQITFCGSACFCFVNDGAGFHQVFVSFDNEACHLGFGAGAFLDFEVYPVTIRVFVAVAVKAFGEVEELHPGWVASVEADCPQNRVSIVDSS